MCYPAVLCCASKLKESVAIFWSTGAISPLLSTGENNDAVILTAQLLHLFATEQKRVWREEEGEVSLHFVCSCAAFLQNQIQVMSDRFEEIRRESGFSGNYIPLGRQLPRTPPLMDVTKHLDFCNADEDCENMEVREEYWSSHISYWLEIKPFVFSSSINRQVLEIQTRKTGRLISARLKLKKVICAVKSARFISFNPALNVHVDLSIFIVVRTHVTTRRPELHAERDEGVPADTERLGVH